VDGAISAKAERERLLDRASTIILSVAVVLTAFSAWQSTLWNGEQAQTTRGLPARVRGQTRR
jgi:hypothetical protein